MADPDPAATPAAKPAAPVPAADPAATPDAAPAATDAPADGGAAPAAARRGVSPVVWVGLAALLIAGAVLAWATLAPVDVPSSYTVPENQEELDRLGR